MPGTVPGAEDIIANNILKVLLSLNLFIFNKK